MRAWWVLHRGEVQDLLEGEHQGRAKRAGLLVPLWVRGRGGRGSRGGRWSEGGKKDGTNTAEGGPPTPTQGKRLSMPCALSPGRNP